MQFTPDEFSLMRQDAQIIPPEEAKSQLKLVSAADAEDAATQVLMSQALSDIDGWVG